MKCRALVALLPLFVTACYYHQDPTMRAAQDLRRLADELVRYEEERDQRFQSIRLGMSPGEVMKILGAPATQRLVTSDAGAQREEWTYRASLRPLGTLTFVDRRVVEIRAE